jgi:uncharacterized Zn finger protein
VQILAIESHRVLALVAGTEDHRIELVGRGKAVGGACSCRAFEDRGFCKHLVATALTANMTRGQTSAEDATPLSRIRRHLKDKGVDALVEMIMDFAECDPAFFRTLELAASIGEDDDETVEARISKAIDAATRIRGFVDYSAARNWARGVNAALDALAELASGRHAALALRLAERAIAGIQQAAQSVDDSDGHCGALLERAGEIHLTAASAARPDPVGLARDLFAREMDSDYDTFRGAAQNYAKVLGKTGLAEYRRLATAAWEKLPSRGGPNRREFSYDHHRLAGILDFFAERDGDFEARIALRAKDLSSPWNYLQLAEFCLAEGRKEEALRRAEEGLWVFVDDPPDNRLVFFTVDLLSKSGRNDEAAAHLWRTFEKAPNLELYARLRTLVGAAARDRAVAFLEARFAAVRRPKWREPADLLIRVLIQERSFDAAWEASRRHGASLAVRESLARVSESTHVRDALDTYSERVEQLATSGGEKCYSEAAKLVVHMARLNGPAEQAAYVAALKQRFERRRNFIKLLG